MLLVKRNTLAPTIKSTQFCEEHLNAIVSVYIQCTVNTKQYSFLLHNTMTYEKKVQAIR